MKMLIGLFSVAISFSAFSSTIDTKTFVYDGSQNSIELILSTEKTHIEYKEEQVRTTCYREEVVGYRTICVGSGYGPRPFPYPYPGYGHCSQTPVYRTVSYPCTQTVSTPVEVRDYDVDARVIIDVTKLSQEATPGETFKVTLKGDELSFDAVGSKKFFIVKKKQDIRSRMKRSVKMIDALLVAELVEAAPLLKAMNMSEISMFNGVLNFDIGEVESQKNLGFSLKIMKLKRLGSDTIILNRELMNSEVEVSANTSGAEAAVNINNLGVQLPKGRYSLTAKTFAKFSGNLMNSNQYSSLSSAKTVKYKVR
jgi:hypothetical protein